jgi:hypothetical protein
VVRPFPYILFTIALPLQQIIAVPMQSERSVHFLVMLVGCIAATMAVVAAMALVLNENGEVHLDGSTSLVLVSLAISMSLSMWVVSRQTRRGHR